MAVVTLANPHGGLLDRTAPDVVGSEELIMQ